MKIRTLATATMAFDDSGLAMTPAIVWTCVIAIGALFWAGVGWAISSWL